MDLIARKKARDKRREQERIRKDIYKELVKKPEKAYTPSSKKLTIITFIIFVIAVPFIYLKSDMVVKESCGLMPGLECDNIIVTSDTITFDVNNYLKEQFNITLRVQGCEETVSKDIRPNKKATYTFTCAPAEEAIKKEIYMTYIGYSGLPHNKTGIIQAKVS